MAKNGDIFDIDVIQAADGASVGTARGTTSHEVIAHAQTIAEGE